MTQVFISYARKDHHFVERLREDFQRNKITYWIDKEGLSPGTRNWERAIRQAIADSYAVVWVVSPASYESEYVSSELAVAEMHKLKIYPVWADGDNWIACVPLGKHNIQFVDMRRDDYSKGLANLLEALNGSKPEIAIPEPDTPTLPAGTEPRNPYKGLVAFTEADTGDFYGRERLTAKLTSRVERQIENQSDRFLAVLGPSGAGKSSVVMAGLLPILRQSHADWLILPKIVPSTHPVEALADALYSVLPDKSLTTIEADLKSAGGRMLHRLAQQVEAEQVILYIDQFEELFTLTADDDERQQFIDLITLASTEPDGKVIVLLSMRADFYGHPANYPQLGSLVNQNNELVMPMTIAELRDAIENPARLPDVGLRFDDGLVAEIIFALRERDKALAGALPLLQFTLERLFAERDDTHLTWSAYNKLGDPEKGISGVEGAIGTHCEEVFSDLPESAQAKLGQVFLPLVSIDENTGEATRRRATIDTVTIDEDSKTFVDNFIDNRLFQTGNEGEHIYLEITHEALFRSWSRLVKWIKEAQEDLILLRQVEREANDWDKSYILSPERLKPIHEAIQRLGRLGYQLSPETQDFVYPHEMLLQELENPETNEQRRLRIGDDLALLGDPRKGVGIKNGLPDIVWLPVRGSQRKFKTGIGSFIVPNLFVARFMTTYSQYQAFIDADDGFSNSTWWDRFPIENYILNNLSEQRTKSSNSPRDNISWFQAVAYANWLSNRFRGIELQLFSEKIIIGINAQIRLPTEWEWQWIAQNGSERTTYPWGNSWGAGRVNVSKSGLGRTVAVGMYPHNQSTCGAMDMAGNLWEWCLNNMEETKTVNWDNSDAFRTLKGGSFNEHHSHTKVSSRAGLPPLSKRNNSGFRLIIAPIIPIR